MREIGVWIFVLIGLLAFLCLMISISAGRIYQIRSWQEPDSPEEDSGGGSRRWLSFVQSGLFFYPSAITFCISALVYIFFK